MCSDACLFVYFMISERRWHGSCYLQKSVKPGVLVKHLWQRPLAREIILVLSVKLILIIAIKLAFFSDPVRPGSEGTARALLSATPTPCCTTPERSTPHD
jgi:3-hydroxymyristoyl/3-hydroxydecanoyl-(acyl carrier protein) dehydratase